MLACTHFFFEITERNVNQVGMREVIVKSFEMF
jgi:hypothetical protein